MKLEDPSLLKQQCDVGGAWVGAGVEIGVKQSGLGREGAHEGLMEFLETQYISVEW